jgi:hypothetical protein
MDLGDLCSFYFCAMMRAHQKLAESRLGMCDVAVWKLACQRKAAADELPDLCSSQGIEHLTVL